MAIAPDLFQLLRRTNPWIVDPGRWAKEWSSRLPSPFLPRILAGWGGSFPTNKATLVIGPRQSGKSSFIWSWMQGLGPGVALVNCEEHLYRLWCTSPATFLAELREVLPSPHAIVLEEVQHLDEAGLFLKGLVDLKPGCPVVATGSSSFHLESKTRESLSGRAARLRVLPFSLAEVAAETAGAPAAIADAETQGRFERMLLFGGYPDAWLSPDPQEVLGELVEGVVVTDASDLYRIDRPEAFRKLLRLMAGQVGNLVNQAEWSAICGVSVGTISRYASILEEAHVVAMPRPWLSGKRAEVTSAPKIFFVDNGIRNAVLGRFAPLDSRDDIGALWENWVLAEILKSTRPLRDSVGFWRTRSGAEVDFVVETAGKVLAIEVKAGDASRILLDRSARSFIEAVKPHLFAIVHGGGRSEAVIGRTKVLWVRPRDVGGLLT